VLSGLPAGSTTAQHPPRGHRANARTDEDVWDRCCKVKRRSRGSGASPGYRTKITTLLVEALAMAA
jgi:hypothetical protein